MGSKSRVKENAYQTKKVSFGPRNVFEKQKIEML